LNRQRDLGLTTGVACRDDVGCGGNDGGGRIGDASRRGIQRESRRQGWGVTGGSYGGFMTSWLITQDSRFAAAAPVAPVTNQVTGHLISNIPHFVALFLADTYTNPGGKYFQRSPIMHAHKVKTPTLNICGALDRCTPPEEAVQFHNALLENRVKSVLITYPEEGHGIRKLPAAIDYAARVVAWFEEHMPAEDQAC
jgi:dipeptidyl aminopeptidase/acylaminoacyl peptidase